MERNDYLIKKKFYAYLIPGVMMVAALQLGNLLDSVFVGNILGHYRRRQLQRLTVPLQPECISVGEKREKLPWCFGSLFFPLCF